MPNHEQEPTKETSPKEDLSDYLREVRKEISGEHAQEEKEAVLDGMKADLFSEEPQRWKKFAETALEGDRMQRDGGVITEIIRERIEPLRKSEDPEDKITLRALMNNLEGLIYEGR